MPLIICAWKALFILRIARVRNFASMHADVGGRARAAVCTTFHPYPSSCWQKSTLYFRICTVNSCQCYSQYCFHMYICLTCFCIGIYHLVAALTGWIWSHYQSTGLLNICFCRLIIISRNSPFLPFKKAYSRTGYFNLCTFMIRVL